MKKTQIKIYAAFSPASAAAYEATLQAGSGAIGLCDDEPWLFLENGLLRLSFEGLYFPVEEVLHALERSVPEKCSGKLDELRLDSWELCRHILKSGTFTSTTRSLNHVLDYSGH